MKIILISPPGTTSEKIYSLIEAGYLAAVLRNKNYQTEIIDCSHSTDISIKISHSISSSKHALICIILQWYNSLKSKWVKDFYQQLVRLEKNFHLTAAGRTATIYFESLLTLYPVNDSVILGEGENTIIRLAECIMQNDNYRTIAGIAFRDDKNKIRHSSGRLISDLDSLPYPARDYLEENSTRYPVIPVNTSRTCYGRCLFCYNNLSTHPDKKKLYRARSAHNVVDEIELLIDHYHANIFYFVDDNFFVDGKQGKIRAAEIADEILKRNLKIRFYIECRANDVELELFKLLKKSGLRNVFLGIESGSQSVLDRLNKEITLQHIHNAIDVLKILKINIEPGFIMFEPNSTLEEIEQNVFLVENSNLFNDNNSSLIFNELKIFPNTPAEKYYQQPIQYLDNRVLLLKDKISEYLKIKNYQLSVISRIVRLKKSNYPSELISSDLITSFKNWKNSLFELDKSIIKDFINDLKTTNIEEHQFSVLLERTLQNSVNEFYFKHFNQPFDNYAKLLREATNAGE